MFANRSVQKRITVIVWAVLGISATARVDASTIYVDDDCLTPGDGTSPFPYCTIQEGVNATQSGDVVILRDGIYQGTGNAPVYIFKDEITLQSENGPENCIIDGLGINQGFVFADSQNSSTNPQIIGLSFARCSSPNLMLPGAAISFYRPILFPATPRISIRRCNFRDNVSTTGTVYLTNLSSVELLDSRFENNDSSLAPSLYISMISDTAIIDRTIFTHNSATGAVALNTSPNAESITFANCFFDRNTNTYSHVTNNGGAMLAKDISLLHINNCTFTNNHAAQFGGAVSLNHSNLLLENSILWNNSATQGPEVYAKGGSFLTISHSNILGGLSGVYLKNSTYSATSILNLDPLLQQDGDYHLDPASPCVNAGIPDDSWPPGATDLDGHPRVLLGRIDLGADEVSIQDEIIEPTPLDSGPNGFLVP